MTTEVIAIPADKLAAFRRGETVEWMEPLGIDIPAEAKIYRAYRLLPGVLADRAEPENSCREHASGRSPHLR